MGRGEFRERSPGHTWPAASIAATLPPPAEAIEYYIEVKADGETALFPATAPGLNQTVIVLPVVK